jgi:hypothetical protein
VIAGDLGARNGACRVGFGQGFFRIAIGRTWARFYSVLASLSVSEQDFGNAGAGIGENGDPPRALGCPGVWPSMLAAVKAETTA